LSLHHTYLSHLDLIAVRAEGEVTFENMQETALAVTDIPEFHDATRVLLDFSKATRLVVNPMQITALGLAMRSCFSERSRRAVVVPAGGMKRIFEQYATYAAPGTMRIFCGREAALCWLEVKIEAGRVG
jgi:hypothetical protein